MPEGFGHLASLADLDMAYCHALAKSEGTYVILSKISTLTKLSLAGCDIEALPEGDCHYSEFYFFIFDVQRVRRSQQPEDARPVVV